VDFRLAQKQAGVQPRHPTPNFSSMRGETGAHKSFGKKQIKQSSSAYLETAYIMAPSLHAYADASSWSKRSETQRLGTVEDCLVSHPSKLESQVPRFSAFPCPHWPPSRAPFLPPTSHRTPAQAGSHPPHDVSWRREMELRCRWS